MDIANDVDKRLMAIMASPSVVVKPVGDLGALDRGILQVAGGGLGRLGGAVKAAFTAAVVAAALMAAAPAAQAAGYDVNGYGQASGQAVQQQLVRGGGSVQNLGSGTELRRAGNSVQRAAFGNGPPVAALQGVALEKALDSVVRSAHSMGVQVDVNKVAGLLATGAGEKEGLHIGKVLGVDHVRGLVYQSTGRGAGEVLAMNSLSRVPAVGEVVTVKIRDGKGVVEDSRGQWQAKAVGR